jgi:hypothetical protein
MTLNVCLSVVEGRLVTQHALHHVVNCINGRRCKSGMVWVYIQDGYAENRTKVAQTSSKIIQSLKALARRRASPCWRRFFQEQSTDICDTMIALPLCADGGRPLWEEVGCVGGQTIRQLLPSMGEGKAEKWQKNSYCSSWS